MDSVNGEKERKVIDNINLSRINTLLSSSPKNLKLEGNDSMGKEWYGENNGGGSEGKGEQEKEREDYSEDDKDIMNNYHDGSDSDSDSDSFEFFGLPERYIEICLLGRGGHGMAKDTLTNRLVAVKRVGTPFENHERAKCCFREVHLLRCLNHPNLVTLYDAFLGFHNGEDNLFLVTEYVSNDLRSVLTTGESLPLERIKRIIKQVLQALTFMHAKDVIHRDLKPENILLTQDDLVKVCDLGLARRKEAEMTGYLATRFYRAPEFMLTWKAYGPAVDMWSVGCILAELATGKLLFPGVDHVNHLRLILELVGSPSEEVLSRICGPSTRQYVALLPFSSGADFTKLFGERLTLVGVDLLKRMLEFDPVARISPAEALEHPFFSQTKLDSRHSDVMAKIPPECAISDEEVIQTSQSALDWSSRLVRELYHFCLGSSLPSG